MVQFFGFRVGCVRVCMCFFQFMRSRKRLIKLVHGFHTVSDFLLERVFDVVKALVFLDLCFVCTGVVLVVNVMCVFHAKVPGGFAEKLIGLGVDDASNSYVGRVAWVEVGRGGGVEEVAEEHR